LDPPTLGKPNFTTNWPSVHAALILLSFGAFGLSCVSGVMYLVQEHDLKFHKLRAIVSKMPPIQRLDSVIARALLVGFVLLSAGLLVSLYHEFTQSPSVNILSDALLLWSIFVWGLYLTILILRVRVEQGGRKFAWGAVGSFAFVLLTFWGFYLLSGIHQS
jgi:HemX protein